ncbi:hypothetical protein HPP92_016277 [Vanilla planifolia]|uniref:Uncharacterized protein n=1 Tax=Vanilla planifolia TaxID=51239 RepID=A0A835USK7_VANPL|nr:hypothetical protein HPP92_016901 [Vanilla planifolia]KAG0471731.1 hypothetical protein HPP92_016277 [Vanilla planifolia]
MSNGCRPCQGTPCQGDKLSWPELLGAKGAIAKEIIERENPELFVSYVYCDARIIQDCCCNRVWLWVRPPPNGHDPSEGIVCHVPRIG